jgi:hypothetical protein
MGFSIISTRVLHICLNSLPLFGVLILLLILIVLNLCRDHLQKLKLKIYGSPLIKSI